MEIRVTMSLEKLFKQYTQGLARGKWIILPCGVIIVVCYFISKINLLVTVVAAIVTVLTIIGWYFNSKEKQKPKGD